LQRQCPARPAGPWPPDFQVGYQLNSAFSSQNVAAVLAWTLSFGAVMAVLEYGVLHPLERHLTRWRRESRV
jgi:NitT/TauT family transport system permease protein